MSLTLHTSRDTPIIPFPTRKEVFASLRTPFLIHYHKQVFDLEKAHCSEPIRVFRISIVLESKYIGRLLFGIAKTKSLCAARTLRKSEHYTDRKQCGCSPRTPCHKQIMFFLSFFLSPQHEGEEGREHRQRKRC